MMKVDVGVKISTSDKMIEFPKGYDCYLIHYSDTFSSSIMDLREKSPNSKLISIHGGGPSSEYNELFDFQYRALNKYDCRDIINETREASFKG